MLADFQQALADLVAAPDHCQSIRDGDLDELDRYDLTMTERGRLVAIALHRGMAANCAIYRSNRLTPIVINLPDTCATLGSQLRPVIDRFWATHPTEHFVHFLVEAERFVAFLEEMRDEDFGNDAEALRIAVAREGAVVRAGLAATTSSRRCGLTG